MKKELYLLAVLVMLVAAACNKKAENRVYKCYCSVTITYQGVTDVKEEDDTIQDVGEAEAQKRCDDYKALITKNYSDSGLPPDDVSCTLTEINK